MAVTSAGTWVAFNGVGDCLPVGVPRSRRFTTVQLLLPDGAVQQFTLPSLPGGALYGGDPALAVEADGRSVLLASLATTDMPHQDGGHINSGTSSLAIVRLQPDGTAELLPSPSRAGLVDDKEFIAVDRGTSSRFRGRLYVAWDEFDQAQVTLRSFDGGAWSPAIQVHAEAAGQPDVAVADDGEVAVVYATANGVQARFSRDGGATLGPPVKVFVGTAPGRPTAGCPLRNSVGQRQRVLTSPRASYDRGGRLHVVAAVAPATAASGNSSDVRYAVVQDRRVTERKGSIPGTTEEFAPSVTTLPDGSGVVAHLALDAEERLTAWGLVFAPQGSLRARTQLSDAPSNIPSAAEAASYTVCYGIGDYTALTTRGSTVLAAWGSAERAERAVADSDVLIRAWHLPR